MSKVLIDSSVWINYFRAGKSIVAEDLNILLDEDRATLCGMVELEILQGLRGKEHNLVQDLFKALDYIETNREDFILAGKMLNQLRQKGITIPSSDCLIAAQCMRIDCALFTLDNDFKHIPSLKRFAHL
jgi:predicted nucleic acid-binding protein